MTSTFLEAVRAIGILARMKKAGNIQSQWAKPVINVDDDFDRRWIYKLLEDHNAEAKARITDPKRYERYTSYMRTLFYSANDGKEYATESFVIYYGNPDPNLAWSERRAHEREAGELVHLLRQDGLIADMVVEEGGEFGPGPPFADCRIVIRIRC